VRDLRGWCNEEGELGERGFEEFFYTILIPTKQKYTVFTIPPAVDLLN
jgi:hypothetical protein